MNHDIISKAAMMAMVRQAARREAWRVCFPILTTIIMGFLTAILSDILLH